MKIVRMNLIETQAAGKVVAFFDIQTDDEIVLKGFKIIDGANGLFISSPDTKGKDGKYYETVILPKEMKESLQKLALDEYNSKAGK